MDAAIRIWHLDRGCTTGSNDALRPWPRPDHGDVAAFTNDLESECLKGLDYAAITSVAQEGWHQIGTAASATNTSMTGESSAIDSSPNV